MTVVRRELPLSRSANHPQRGLGCRIAQARALQSCPHRRAGDPLQETHSVMSSQAAVSAGRVMAAQTKPASSRATAATATVARLP